MSFALFVLLIEILGEATIEEMAVLIGKPPNDQKFLDAFYLAAKRTRWNSREVLDELHRIKASRKATIVGRG